MNKYNLKKGIHRQGYLANAYLNKIRKVFFLFLFFFNCRIFFRAFIVQVFGKNLQEVRCGILIFFTMKIIFNVGHLEDVWIMYVE